MKPAAFDYLRPASLDEAVLLLARHGSDAKILAGGQSLVPLLNFRMLRPSILVDINRVAELSFLRAEGAGLRIGALTRHHALETSPLVRERFPVLTAAMGHVAHLAIRNRGTTGGSLSHADPAAELPMMAMLLDAAIHTRSAGQERVHAAEAFFLGPLTSALEENEVVTEIVLPGLAAGTGWAFEEFAQRSGDFAIAAVAATIRLERGRIAEARLALMGVDETPVRLRGVEADLAGQAPSADLARHAAEAARDAVRPNTDLKASAEYRRHLVAGLVERALATAVDRARNAPR
ncbi:FAD binding domain-containing protein [Methylobacterium sp. ID0610]|uniref:FAD binding domain-containing protein n=1 Tax=Methylobacterium carpenticola TaxID=3344827 RepID=UPI003674CE65